MLLSLSSGANMIVQFITVLVMFVFVLAITYFTTRWIANYQKGSTFNQNIEVLDVYKIAPNKYIQIVKTGKKILVIGIAKDTITMLTELTEDEISIVERQGQQGLDFKDILEKAKSLKIKK